MICIQLLGNLHVCYLGWCLRERVVLFFREMKEISVLGFWNRFLCRDIQRSKILIIQAYLLYSNITIIMLSSSPIFEKQNGSALTSSSDSACERKLLSKSNIQSKSVGPPSIQIQHKMALLKQKAHQSFMQVIQMQQLHQQQIQQLRKQFQLKEELLQSQLAALQLRIHHLEYQNLVLDKNYRRHHCSLKENDFSIDNIQVISCTEESRLDYSAVCHFCEIVDAQSYQMKNMPQLLEGELITIYGQSVQPRTKSQATAVKLFQYVTHLKKQLTSFQQACAQTKRQLEQSQSKNFNCQTIYESLQKQTIFLGEKANRLASQKMKGQRKIMQLQRKLQQVERLSKRGEGAALKKAQKVGHPLKKSESRQINDISLDMNEFIKKSLARAQREENLLRNPIFSKKAKN